jgi:hypothetical protein
MRLITGALILLMASPAAGQSFYPNIAGQRYCDLRKVGVSSDEAIKAAIKDNIAPYRTSPKVMVSGIELSLDQLDFIEYVKRCQ